MYNKKMKEKTLSEKIQSSVYVEILEVEDVKQFIKEILDELEDGWMYSARKIKRIIKQKAGFKDLE